MVQLKDELGKVTVSEPVEAGPLRLYGLRWKVPGDLDYGLLDDAMADESITVTEISESGSVPTVSVTNKGDVMVFFMAGEHLIGAKQNRVLNVSLVVPRKAAATIPVSCVEKGRWGYKSRGFYGSGSSSHSRLRRKMSRQVSESYMFRGMADSDQSAVWEEVDRKLYCMGSSSGSAALEQVYEDHRARLGEILERARVPDDCQGVVFAFGGQVAGMDLFDKPATLKKMMPKLVRGYAIDALETSRAHENEGDEPALACEDVARWLKSAGQASFERFDSPGAGDDIRIVAETLTGAGLVVEDHPIHVELFPADDDGTPARRTPRPRRPDVPRPTPRPTHQPPVSQGAAPQAPPDSSPANPTPATDSRSTIPPVTQSIWRSLLRKLK